MAGARILCVDTDPTVLATLALVVRSAGHDVLTSATATEALKVLNTTAIDLLLSGCCLQDAKVEDLIQQAKAAQPNLRVVLYLAHQSESSDAADAVIWKPAPPEELLDTIRRLLEVTDP